MTPRAYRYMGRFETSYTIMIFDTHTCSYTYWEPEEGRWKLGPFRYARDDLSKSNCFTEISWLEVLTRVGQSREQSLAALKKVIEHWKLEDKAVKERLRRDNEVKGSSTNVGSVRSRYNRSGH